MPATLMPAMPTAWLRGPQRAPNLPAMWKHVVRLALIALIILVAIGWWALQPDHARLSNAELTGRVPVLSAVRPQTVPTIRVADAIGWPAGRTPVAAPGLRVVPFATGLAHPRVVLPLANGDVLVVETAAPPRPAKSGVTAQVEKMIMGKAGAVVASANRISLLRDADGDGVAETKTAFLTGLNSPHGIVMVGTTLYVANTDAVMAFDYVPGATSITTPGRKIVDLPGGPLNHHWTKSIAASPDGSILYVGVGSNSNIGENGLAAEQGRALIFEVHPAQKYRRTFAAGLRNPAGLTINPATGELWASVNERDQLGSDMVPDYMSRVSLGDFFGWPWYYWGGFVDDRVAEPDSDDRREYVRRPDYALGVHVAPLGLTFARSDALGAPWTNGMFVALHGSWNRSPAAGYKLVFVPFGEGGVPAEALPLDVLSGFVTADGKAMGRPADVAQAADGALYVADDVGDVVWRVTRR